MEMFTLTAQFIARAIVRASFPMARVTDREMIIISVACEAAVVACAILYTIYMCIQKHIHSLSIYLKRACFIDVHTLNACIKHGG